MYATAYNTTDQPVPIDDDGRTLGGKEWGTVKVDEPSVQRSIAAEHLVLVADVGEGTGVDRDAKAAHDRTLELNGSPSSSRHKEKNS